MSSSPYEDLSKAARRYGVSSRFAWCLENHSSLDDFFKSRQTTIYGNPEPSADAGLLRSIPPPELFKDMTKAVRRIVDALESNEPITIFGDYDVDGTTSCAMLRRFFSELGYSVHIYIPERLVEGYGVNPIGLKNINEGRGGLVVTVDNGIAACGACAFAKTLGLDVIITDHHEVPDVLPDAFAILNPKQKDCTYPYKMLAGVGVAFYLMIALRQELRNRGHHRAQAINLKSYLDFVAIGTIADVAPLTGVNHVLCKIGLDVLSEHVRQKRRPGVGMLLNLAGWSGEENVSSTDVGFKIGPRLNAAGRLGTALATEELLSTDNVERARILAEQLHTENTDRQTIEKQIKEQAFEQIRAYGNALPEAFVLYNESWHTGVVGIVASRILEKFYRPTLVLGSLDGKMKGSGRSTHAFDLFSALNKVRDEFISFGGHFHAVGLTAQPEKLNWLKNYLSASVREVIPTSDMVKPLHIDAAVPLGGLTQKFMERISTFEPFGAENPRPRFLIRGAEFVSLKRIGKNIQAGHAQVKIDDGTSSLDVTAFSMADELERAAKEGARFDIVVEGKNETWRNQRRLKLQLIDFMSGQ